MPKYNIYKIIKNRQQAMQAKLESVGLTTVFDRKIDGARLTFHVSVEPEFVPVWWVKLYEDFLDEETRNRIKNAMYFAVCTISTDEYCYAVSLGKSHFYLKEFCDIDFGIDMGTRIISEHSVCQKSARLFGGRRRRSILTYQGNTPIELDSGEAIVYLKGDTLSDAWGSKARCGNSVALTVTTKPYELPDLIRRIEEELRKPPLFKVPHSMAISDADLTHELDTKLCNSIRSRESVFMMEQQTLSGVDFLFMPQYDLELRAGGHRIPIEPDISLDRLNAILDEAGISVTPDNLDRIKIRASSENLRGFTGNIREFVDYVDNGWYYLEDGKWRKFNEVYVDFLKSSVDRIPVMSNSDFHFNDKAYNSYVSCLPSTLE